ncbi:GMC family oxidoreductase [Rhodopila sp.]|uniref:GMC family oxidoreductase n=1 Tax=Rhodopila sp. TaxID=2480087 RepID=UPI003D0E235E
MLIDFRSADIGAALEVDVCIVGAGAAGIAIATSLIETHHQVCVLESGGLDFEAETQALYEGEAVGVPWGTDLATSRLRFFGGTTNHWGGGCIPLDEMDFRQRPWVPHSGWPISRSDLDPWYDRARPVLHIPDIPFDNAAVLARTAPPFQFDPDKLVHRYDLPSQQPRLGPVYRARLERAANVRVLLHANLIAFATNNAANAVSEARIRTLEGKSGLVRARYFVLACGGIENARLLLLSNAVNPQGLGNSHDLVGRFFMDHPSGKLGTITSDAPARLADPYNRQLEVPGVPHPGEISLSRTIQERARLLNGRLRPQDYEESPPDGVLAVRQFDAGLRDGHFSGGLANEVWRMAADLGDIVPGIYRRLLGRPVVPLHRIDFEGFFEQAPNPDSRVSLADTIDALGQQRVRLDWRLTELDRRTYRAAADIFGSELARLGLGRVQLDPWLRPGADGGVDGNPEIQGVAHHLGTTRMSDDPRKGVVDPDCRIHGIDNLYVVGGSVFPAGGWAFPTFTIVALALRLTDHLTQRLNAG